MDFQKIFRLATLLQYYQFRALKDDLSTENRNGIINRLKTHLIITTRWERLSINQQLYQQSDILKNSGTRKTGEKLWHSKERYSNEQQYACFYNLRNIQTGLTEALVYTGMFLMEPCKNFTLYMVKRDRWFTVIRAHHPQTALYSHTDYQFQNHIFEWGLPEELFPQRCMPGSMRWTGNLGLE